MQKSEHLLSVENLHVQIGKRMILRDISFSVKPGEIIGIIGPNGCGKTTLLNTLSGFLPVDTGTVSFSGVDIMQVPSYKRAEQGISRGFQNAGVFREMTVEENLILTIETAEKLPWWWKFSKKRRTQVFALIEKILRDVDLFEHRLSLAGLLSGGQLRLLELARLRLSGAKLLLIDEPTAGVAPILRTKLSEVIVELVKEHGHTAVIVEHDIKFLFNIADRIIVLLDGEKYLEGTPEEVRADERLRKVYLGE